MIDSTPGGSRAGDFAPGGSHADDSSGEAGPTGDLRVDAALAHLEELAELPVTSHVEVFENVHRQLHEALTALDEG